MKLLEAGQLKGLQDVYTKVEAHLAEASSDPPNLPYRSKYMALEELGRMRDIVTELGDGEHQSAISSFLLAKAGVMRTEVEEPSIGEKLLLAGLETCDKVGEERITLACRLTAHNQLGILWCQRDDMIKARQHLEKALNIYFNFRQAANQQDLVLLHQLLFPEDSLEDPERKVEDPEEHVELLVTHTYYFLAQVHGKLGNAKKSAEFCHETLARQLKAASYDPLDWATNAAVLSQFYLNHNNHDTARYHLVSARVVFDKHFDSEGGMKSGGEGVVEKEVEDEVREKVLKCQATIDRLGVKYGLHLLEFSCSEADEAVENVEAAEDEAVESPVFDKLDLGDRLEEVRGSKVSDWESARLLFLWSQARVVASQKYFSMEERCSEYVELAREHSQLYKHLITWEADPDRQAKMLRRRADLLEPVLAELNVAHYLLTVRQLRFELGEIFSDMMDLKRERLQAEPGNPQVIKKVNMLVQQAVRHFSAFQDTMKVDGKLPKEYNEDTVRPALLCHFYLGRLASKLVVPDRSEQQLQNVLATFAAYKAIVDYCEAHPVAAEVMEGEVEVCKEMVRLMPVRIEKLRRELVRN